MNKIPLLSIITPFYNEAEGVEHYFSILLPILEGIRLGGEAGEQGLDFEVLCIDDGSSDVTLPLLLECARRDERIKVLQFSRNFGKEAALSAGLDFCRGDAAIPLDADLQDPPELIPKMLQLWYASKGSANGSIDVVLPVRTNRKDPLFKKLTAKLFYELIGKISSSDIPRQVADFRLLDRRVIDVICQLREKHRFMRGLLSWPGFRIEHISYQRPERKYGETKYNYKRMLSYALDGIFAFSTVPLRFFSYFGSLVLLIGLFLALRAIVIKLWLQDAEPGYTSTIVLLVFFSGAILLGQGIIGEYIGRIYHEVKNRPIYVVQNSYNIEDTKQK
ncbi:glycosyltransferase family 2 protein [Candidatus Haliotispira prima]|uniref:Glycosyltransferase family 2 protein n=1 Tax=Candidatus Haliotispira prima TaxID=3034016 RepID=A0ABY8MKC5_9SPIO|nr:glycosyltransferase family 2 protein [Candidatus Haliotispira prima]